MRLTIDCFRASNGLSLSSRDDAAHSLALRLNPAPGNNSYSEHPANLESSYQDTMLYFPSKISTSIGNDDKKPYTERIEGQEGSLQERTLHSRPT